MNTSSEHSHFKGKNPLEHVLETKSKSSCEPHSIALASHLFAATDTAKNLSVFSLLLLTIMNTLNFEPKVIFEVFVFFSLGVLIAYSGRSAWIGFAHLERLHRSLKQEHYEIEHHRHQEREELQALYKQKGFEGQLLEQVVDVLMADEDRLLKVMLEEEMGFSLGTHEHPLKQAFGAFVGGFLAILTIGLCLFFFSLTLSLSIGFILIALSAALAAYFENNRIISSCVWALAIAALAVCAVYFSLKILHSL